MEGDWIEIPGSGGASLLPFTRYPDVCCPNAYLVRAPGEIIVIDTGGDEAHIASIVAAICAANGERSRDISVLLTHCRLDHAYGVIRHREEIRSSRVAIFA